MTKLDRTAMQQEIANIKFKYKEHGISKTVSFAYPGNMANSLSQSVPAEMGYRYARTCGRLTGVEVVNNGWMMFDINYKN